MKRLLIGIEDFKELIEKEYYYVDKTMFIKNVLERKVVLYTRPHWFGKILNMSMLHYFFSVKQREDIYLFNGSSVMKRCGTVEHLNKYPALMVSLRK